jgi:hypothetical protein
MFSLDFWESPKNPGNPNKKSIFLLFGFEHILFGFPGFLFGFRRFCMDFGFEFFGSTKIQEIQTKTLFCFDYLDFCLDFT